MDGHLPTELTNDEWNQLEAAVLNTRFEKLVRRFRDTKNLPQKVFHVFDDSTDYNQGEESVNAILRNAQVPLRLRRSGPAAGPRDLRRLSFERWHATRQLRLPLNLPRRRYRKYS